MDVREAVGLENLEEVLRVFMRGQMARVWTAMPAQVSEDTAENHVSALLPTIKRAVLQDDGSLKYEDHAEHRDVPIHHLSGGGITQTFPNKKGDTGLVIYASRNIDSWFQSDGTQQPLDDRTHSLGDGFYISGPRSEARKLKQVALDSSQRRSDDKHHVDDLHPTQGLHHKSVDPSTPVASDGFDPFTQATKFFERILHPQAGAAANATDGGTTHSHGVDHVTGPWMWAVNQLHSVLCDPTSGPSMNAKNKAHQVLAHPLAGAILSSAFGAHTVTASPSGVNISSSSQISLSAPSVSVPDGSMGGSSLAAGAAAQNVGQLGGDLSGTLPNPKVVSLLNVKNAHVYLLNAANDSAAQALGVQVGQLYRNGSVVMVRVA